MGEARRRGTYEERKKNPKGPPSFQWPKKWFYRLDPEEKPTSGARPERKRQPEPEEE